MVVRVIIAVLDGRVAGGSATPYPYSVIWGANPIQIENVSEFDGTSDSTTMDTSPTTTSTTGNTLVPLGGRIYESNLEFTARVCLDTQIPRRQSRR
jgi:hypothetical protein